MEKWILITMGLLQIQMEAGTASGAKLILTIAESIKILQEKPTI